MKDNLLAFFIFIVFPCSLALCSAGQPHDYELERTGATSCTDC